MRCHGVWTLSNQLYLYLYLWNPIFRDEHGMRLCSGGMGRSVAILSFISVNVISVYQAVINVFGLNLAKYAKTARQTLLSLTFYY